MVSYFVMDSAANCLLTLVLPFCSSPLVALTVWFFLLQYAWAQLSDAPPAAKFLRRGHCRVTVLGNHVYIDGGEISQLANPGGGPMKSTLSIDISTSWSAQTVEIKATPKGDHGPVALSDETIWTDPSSNAFYIFGGRAPNGFGKENITKDGIWKFTADGEGGGAWALEKPSNAHLLQSINLTDSAAFASTYGSQRLGFHIAGTTADESDPGVKSGRTGMTYMITYDMKSKELASFDLSAAIPPSGGLRNGRAEYIPQFGSNGLVFLLGGTAYDKTLQPDRLLDFRNITFFDPKTGQWMWQTTSGDIPQPRQTVCMTGVAGPAGTYELFVFGGADETSMNSYDDLYVLSLPGFVWFQAPERSVESRANAACALIGNHQMLVVGGHDFTSGAADRYWQTKDVFPQGLGLFNMTAMTWVKDYAYHADAQDYKSPQVVEDWYRQNTNLSSTVPWSSDEVKNTFLAKPVLFDNSDSNSNFTKSSPTNNNASSTNNNKAGKIAGGVVGAFVATTMLLAVIYYFWIRKPSPSSLVKLGSTEGTLPSNNKTELSAEPLVTEMPVSCPPDLGRSHEETTHELNAQSDIYELDVTSCAGELDVPNQAGDPEDRKRHSDAAPSRES